MTTRLLLLILAGGFTTLFFDVRFEHGGILSQNRLAYIPLVAAATGITACLIGLVNHPVLRKTLSVIMGLTAASGVLGFYYHTGFNPEVIQTVLNSNHRAEHVKGLGLFMDGEPMPDAPPALAPLGFTGLSLIAAVALFPRRKGASD